MADARNGRGFAGIRIGGGFNIIDEPRGLPADVSFDVSLESDKWGSDGHSHSWFTLQELLDFNWGQVTKHVGLVSEYEYKQWKKRGGTPAGYASTVGGPMIKICTEKEYAELPSRALNIEYYIKIDWTETYRSSCQWFLDEVVPKLKGLAKNPTDVRLVFWFDN